jgi:hypothetical protein
MKYWKARQFGLDWGVSESTVCRRVHQIENILIRSRKFSLPGKKSLLNSSLDTNLIVMDVMESPIERPTKHQKIFYSGKQKEHTLKTQSFDTIYRSKEAWLLPLFLSSLAIAI